jgi:hypothetical protein
MGNDEVPNQKSPRGIRGFKLNNGTFSTWTVQGKKGSYTKYVSKDFGHTSQAECLTAFPTAFVVHLTKVVRTVSDKAGISLGSTRLPGKIDHCLLAYPLAFLESGSL